MADEQGGAFVGAGGEVGFDCVDGWVIEKNDARFVAFANHGGFGDCAVCDIGAVDG